MRGDFTTKIKNLSLNIAFLFVLCYNILYYFFIGGENILNTKKQQFFAGAKDAFPVFLGYLTVAVTFGVIAVSGGLPAWSPTVISMTCFTGTGQFVGVNLISTLASYAEIFSALLVINARYFLMGISLSQKLPPEIKLWQRLIIAFGNTDENYAIALQPDKKVTFAYFMGLIFSSYSGWVGGTILGTVLGDIIPASVTGAMGIALYAMYVAIIVPPATTSKPIVCVIAFAVIISSIIKFVPIFASLGSGWSVIISGVVASALGAVLFPMEVCEDERTDA